MADAEEPQDSDLIDLGDIDLERLAELPLSTLATSLRRILEPDQVERYVAFNSRI